MEMEQKREQFNQLIEKFYERNIVNDKTDEEYLENFRLRVGKFLSQKPLKENPEVKEIIFNCLKDDYLYYSEKHIAAILKAFHEKLSKDLLDKGVSISDCCFIDILNKRTEKNNSSNVLVNQYLNENYLPNNYSKHFSTMVNIELKNERHNNGSKNYSYYTEDIYKIEKENEIAVIRSVLKDKKYLIMIDDYSGTGSTIKDFIKILKKYIPSDIQLIVFCIHITEGAQKTLMDFFNQEAIKCHIYAYHTSPKYFHKDDKSKHLVKKFEEDYVKPNSKYILGFRETQSVLTTYRNTPNNTLSLFWSESIDNNGWRPIFLRKDKDGKIGELKEVQKLGNKIRWYFRYKKISKENEELLILLIYLMFEGRKSVTGLEVEISHIICYTDEVIEECERQNLIVRIDSCFELSDEGREILKQYSLYSDKSEDILNDIEEKFEESGKQMEVNRDDSTNNFVRIRL